MSLAEWRQSLQRSMSLDVEELERIAAGAAAELQFQIGDDVLLTGLLDVRARALDILDSRLRASGTWSQLIRFRQERKLASRQLLLGQATVDHQIDWKRYDLLLAREVSSGRIQSDDPTIREALTDWIADLPIRLKSFRHGTKSRY